MSTPDTTTAVTMAPRWQLMLRGFALGGLVMVVTMLLIGRFLPGALRQDLATGICFAVAWAYRPGWARPGVRGQVLAHAAAMLALYLLARVVISALSRG